MTQAFRFNVAAVLGLVAMFAGGWIVFGLGVALLIFGAGTWITAIVTLLASALRARAS